ncbi:MAG: glycosyl hydrolase family 79 C-terminal domain-containing protein, partial [Candidatus Dormibacteraeota bacterium]|nr:glycosyl hydrolase family 79 C-terminal domain-containing protein [Candidatus Dormibacteraeota bacterium]
MAALGLALGMGGAPAASADTLSASVSGTPTGQPMPPGFLGVSLEYRALHQYTGRDPRAVDPVLVALLKGLAPGSAPSLRIGGNSSDATWWPIPGVIPPGGIYYRLTAGWLRTTQALAADLQTRMILGINLAAGRPAIAAAEGRAFVQGIGRRYIQALEIGNEPDLYGVFPWYRDRRGHLYGSRGRHYSLSDYTQEFARWSAALPRGIALAGPATSGPSWMSKLGKFIRDSPRLGLITYHRYPLRACTADPSQASFASIPHLLADTSSSGLARGVVPFLAVAHAHHLPFRLTEINTASCQGAAGVSDTFASALWSLNTMFNLASAGIDGVNFHMLPGSRYELFSTSQTSGGAWQAFVHPEYYGLYMFAQAFPPAARLLAVNAPSGPVKVWATQGSDGAVRVTMINQDPAGDHTIALQLPGNPGAAALESLTAPSLSATSGVTLGGQTFANTTTTGTFPSPPAATTVLPAGGSYSIDVPAASAALLST